MTFKKRLDQPFAVNLSTLQTFGHHREVFVGVWRLAFAGWPCARPDISSPIIYFLKLWRLKPSHGIIPP